MTSYFEYWEKKTSKQPEAVSSQRDLVDFPEITVTEEPLDDNTFKRYLRAAERAMFNHATETAK